MYELPRFNLNVLLNAQLNMPPWALRCHSKGTYAVKTPSDKKKRFNNHNGVFSVARSDRQRDGGKWEVQHCVFRLPFPSGAVQEQDSSQLSCHIASHLPHCEWGLLE